MGWQSDLAALQQGGPALRARLAAGAGSCFKNGGTGWCILRDLEPPGSGQNIAGIFLLYMNRYQIRPEERALSVMFGTEFIAYKKRPGRAISLGCQIPAQSCYYTSSLRYDI